MRAIFLCVLIASLCVDVTKAAGDGTNAYIDAHNAKRLLHCDTACAALGAQLAAGAQAYANTCPEGHATNLNHLNAGENLFWAGFQGSAPTADASFRAAVESWYEEISSWDFASSSSRGGVTGHFTQIVWKTSTIIGCGVKLDCENKFNGFTNSAVVCRYQQMGNYQGQYAQNVGNLVSTGCSGAGTCPSTRDGGTGGGIAGCTAVGQPCSRVTMNDGICMGDASMAGSFHCGEAGGCHAHRSWDYAMPGCETCPPDAATAATMTQCHGAAGGCHAHRSWDYAMPGCETCPDAATAATMTQCHGAGCSKVGDPCKIAGKPARMDGGECMTSVTGGGFFCQEVNCPALARELTKCTAAVGCEVFGTGCKKIESNGSCDQCVEDFKAAGGCEEFDNESLIPTGCDACGDAAAHACDFGRCWSDEDCKPKCNCERNQKKNGSLRRLIFARAAGRCKCWN